MLFINVQTNALVKTGLTRLEALDNLFKKYLAEYETANPPTKNEINQITDYIFKLRLPLLLERADKLIKKI